jgi:hypothetical protein
VGGYERSLDLEIVQKAYVGGFEPELFWRREGTRKIDPLLSITLRYQGRLLESRRLRACGA